MKPDLLAFAFFRKHREYAAIFIRLIIGAFLIWGVQDNILSYERMQEFERFLAARGVPLPLLAAHVSVYAQFICGVSVLLGAFVRLTSILLIINFIAALIIAHRNDTFAGMFPALVMLAAGFFFLFHGAGRPSVDAALDKRTQHRRAESLRQAEHSR
ncbi:MAG: DoxX family protein [Pyrinomonadaceae bacterium]|nr:DoxX family protein [Pyrinomonadaceae bacterium]